MSNSYRFGHGWHNVTFPLGTNHGKIKQVAYARSPDHTEVFWSDNTAKRPQGSRPKKDVVIRPISHLCMSAVRYCMFTPWHQTWSYSMHGENSRSSKNPTSNNNFWEIVSYTFKISEKTVRPTKGFQLEKPPCDLHLNLSITVSSRQASFLVEHQSQYSYKLC